MSANLEMVRAEQIESVARYSRNGTRVPSPEREEKQSGPVGKRLKPHHQEDIKLKIKTTQIIRRLQKHIDGKLELSATQVSAAQTLLRKVIPDLASTETHLTVESMSDVLRQVSERKQGLIEHDITSQGVTIEVTDKVDRELSVNDQ